MGMLDFFTGGDSSDAQDALRRAGDAFQQVKVPTVEQLTLPQLQEYVQAGIMTPAEAQAYLQTSNAYATENTPQTGNEAMIQALGQLSDISDAGPMGTPTEQSQIAQAIEQMNTSVAGQRGAIEQSMEAKGTPAALVQAALENQTVGQDAQQSYLNSLQAQSQAYQQAVQALSEKGAIGNTLQTGQNAQGNVVANAANAMQQFNAANQTKNSEFNAANRNAANLYNTQNTQNVSNANTQTKNARTTYNAQLPETVFGNQMTKAGDIAGVNVKQSDLSQEQGKQEAGIWSGIIGAGADLGGDYMTSQALSKAFPGTPAAAPAASSAAVPAAADMMFLAAKGGVVPSHDFCYHDGGICMEGGGMIPGRAKVPGDSLRNDTVDIKASPGEAVIPRSAVQNHMPEVLSMISEARNQKPTESAAHPQDVATLLHALRAIRTGAA